MENVKEENILSAHSMRRFYWCLEICGELRLVMNELHNVNYSARFWEMMLMSYAGVTVSQHKVFSEKEIHAAPEFEEFNGFAPPSLKEKIKPFLITLIKKTKSINSFRLTHKLLQTEKQLTMSFPAMQEIRDTLGKPIPENFILPFGKGNTKLRAKLYSIAARQENIFLKNAIRQMPKVYVEYFEHLFTDIPLIEPQTKSFHVHLTIGVYNRMILAKYIENGARLFWYQHGANYGERVGGSHNLERRLADELRTWGWKTDDKDVPWIAYRLEKFSQQYQVATQKKEFDLLACFPNLDETNEKPYREKSDYLLKHINPNKYKKFLARPRALNKIFSHAHRIAFVKDSRVAIDSGLTSMPEIIAKCRAVVQFSIPGTNFLECIYVDHPTLGLLENDEPTELVKPHYDFLFEVGVLHNNFESLVNHLNNIDIENWWATVLHDDRYQHFKHTFCRRP